MSTELVRVESDYMPIMTLAQSTDRYNAIVDYVKKIMRPTIDYGVIPGSSKPTLLKPGAEKLASFFGLGVEDPEIVTQTEDWTGKDHGGEPFFYYQVRQRLTRGGRVIASQMGSCNSWETKYRYRNASKKCPSCGGEFIIKGKKEYDRTGGEGGWLCFKKKGGCGATFADGTKSIEDQPAGKVINTDIADQVNTILKMALKRSLIAAVLIAVNASEFFTQDLEDLHIDVPEPPRPPQPPPQTGELTEADATALETYCHNLRTADGTTEAEAIAALTAVAKTVRKLPKSVQKVAWKGTLEQASDKGLVWDKDGSMFVKKPGEVG